MNDAVNAAGLGGKMADAADRETVAAVPQRSSKAQNSLTAPPMPMAPKPATTRSIWPQIGSSPKSHQKSATSAMAPPTPRTGPSTHGTHASFSPPVFDRTMLGA